MDISYIFLYLIFRPFIFIDAIKTVTLFVTYTIRNNCRDDDWFDDVETQVYSFKRKVHCWLRKDAQRDKSSMCSSRSSRSVSDKGSMNSKKSKDSNESRGSRSSRASRETRSSKSSKGREKEEKKKVAKSIAKAELL